MYWEMGVLEGFVPAAKRYRAQHMVRLACMERSPLVDRELQLCSSLH